MRKDRKQWTKGIGLWAAAHLGVAPANCTVFEDAVAGIQSAHAAGMRVVAITTTNPRATLQSAGADRIIDSFAELHDW